MHKKILFDVERMKYAHTGLYHFCLNLGKALEKEKPADCELHFFANQKVPKVFGQKALYIPQRSLQKFYMPKFAQFAVWHSTFQLTAYLPRAASVKVVATIHDLNFLKEGKTESKIKNYIEKLQHVIDRAQEVVAISNYVKHDIENHCDLKGKKVHVIYNGSNIDESLVPEIADKKPLVDGAYIYAIGTVNKKKNFHVLPYLLQGNDLKLVISGTLNEPGYDEKIKTIAAEIGVGERVIITGSVSEEEKMNYLYNCAIFAFPSIAEGFGLPVIEAMSLGKQVLLSTYTCLPEIGGPEAFYLDNTEPDYLADFGRSKLMDIINSPSRAEEIKLWAAQFSWKISAEKYWALYEHLIGKS